MGNLLSTSSTPRLYEGIRLLLADPEKQFPEEFDPQFPMKVKLLNRVSREGFIDKVKLEEGVGVVPLEDFNPQGIKEDILQNVELRNGATYIVIPRQDRDDSEIKESSTSSTPRLYEGIRLLLADPEKQFPEEFDPQFPMKVKLLNRVSREGFIDKVKLEEGVGVVPLEDFNPQGIKEDILQDVELRDGATYIIVPRRGKSYEKRFEGVEAYQKNQTDGDERMLVEQAIKYLEDSGHANVRPLCLKRITGPGGRAREIDAAATADNCAVVIEHKTSNKDKGEGSVSQFSGKRIIGVLAGPAETRNVESKKDMDGILQDNGFFKWFERGDYGDDPCSPFKSSGASCGAPVPTDSPGNGPTAPCAVPCRVGRPLAPMRRSAMLVRPRLANRVAVRRPFI